MLFEMHVHTAEYSPDSVLPIEAAVMRARSLGLGGICITDHDSMGAFAVKEMLAMRHGILVVVGVEICSPEGDLLLFGLEEMPPDGLSNQERIAYVRARGGEAVAAHPYRDNAWGVGDAMATLQGLAAVEALNGNTKPHLNHKAWTAGRRWRIPLCGGSDAHALDAVGTYVTRMPDGIVDEAGFLAALRCGAVEPMVRTEHDYRRYEGR